MLPQTNDYSFGQLPDLPADFGPAIGPDGIEGLLVVGRHALQPWTLQFVVSYLQSAFRHRAMYPLSKESVAWPLLVCSLARCEMKAL